MSEPLARAREALAALQAGYVGDLEDFNLISQVVLDGVPALLDKLMQSDALLGETSVALQASNDMLAELERRLAERAQREETLSEMFDVARRRADSLEAALQKTQHDRDQALRQRDVARGALEALYTWGEMDPRQRSPELTAKVLGLVHDVIPATVEAEHARRREGGR